MVVPIVVSVAVVQFVYLYQNSCWSLGGVSLLCPESLNSYFTVMEWSGTWNQSWYLHGWRIVEFLLLLLRVCPEVIVATID